MATKKRVVVVGLGSIGRRHTRLLLERGDVAVEVVEPDDGSRSSALAEVGDLPVHESFDQMLTTTPPIVWIATPTALHAEQTIAALAAGAHVFCEKPMSYGLQDALHMKEASDRSSKVLNIGFHLHFWPGLAALKRRIESGDLGQVLHAHAHVGTYITLLNSRSRYQAHKQGSLVWDYSHQPDILYWLLQTKPTEVHTVGFQGGQLERSSNPNVAVVTCRHGPSLISTIHLNYVQMPERHAYEIVGDQGWAVLDFNEGRLRLGRRKDEQIDVEAFSTDRDDIYRAEQQAFFDTIDGNRGPETSAADGLVSMQVCESAVESWKTGEWVELGKQMTNDGMTE